MKRRGSIGRAVWGKRRRGLLPGEFSKGNSVHLFASDSMNYVSLLSSTTSEGQNEEGI